MQSHALALNHETGFMESNGYAEAMAFDTERKLQFLKAYKANGLRFRTTCKSLGLSHHTVLKHYNLDEAFRQGYDEVEREYAEELEARQMAYALEPKHFMDRCMQLRRLYPDRYAPEKSSGSTQITINVTPDALSPVLKRQEILEAEMVKPLTLDATLVHSAALPPSMVRSSIELRTGEEEGRE